VKVPARWFAGRRASADGFALVIAQAAPSVSAAASGAAELKGTRGLP
jgi:hypothetical protein